MFSRTSYLVPTCLRCQTRLAARSQVWRISSGERSTSCSRRWQSTVALKDDADISAGQSEEQIEDATDRRLPTQDEFYEADRVGKEGPPRDAASRTHTAFRRWAPPPAEKLGVDVLGTPAEVLILPTRKRKLAQHRSEKDSIEETGGIQQSLDSELRPVSLTEVLQNVDSLKEEFGKGKHEFTALEWNEFRGQLGDGFTKMQLQEYLRISSGQNTTSSHEIQHPSTITKRDLAAKIMSDVWRWTCRDVEEITAVSKPALIKKNVVVKAAKLEYIMLYEKQQLSQISEAFDVQIDVFKKKMRIRLSGSESALIAASSSLNRLVKGIQELVIRIPRYLKDVLNDEDKANGLCATLMHEHRILIQRDGEVFTVIGPATIGTDTIIKDLVVLSGKLRNETHYSFCWASGQESAIEVPVYPSDLPPWLRHSDGWYRHVSTQSSPKAEDLNDRTTIREVRKLVGNLLKSEKPDRSRLSHFIIAPGALSHDYTADLGQALFRSGMPKSQTSGTSSIDQSIAEVALVLQQPMLPQVLNRKDLAKVNAGVTDEAPHALLLHLRLHPVVPSWRSPPIDLYLTGQDRKLGLRQRLHIKGVFATLDEWQHMILLPHLSMDMLMKRRSRIDLLCEENAKDTNPYLDVLRQLGSYLEQARSPNRTRLPSIWRINTLPFFNSKRIGSSSQSEDVQLKAQPNNPDSSSNNSASEADSPVAYVSTYMLETPEYLDVTSYLSPPDGDRNLDHIVCQTDSTDQPRQRQILRVAADSLCTLLDEKKSEDKLNITSTIEKQRWFKQSVTAAYETARIFKNAEKVDSQVGDALEIDRSAR